MNLPLWQFYAFVTQWIEYPTVNRRRGGSIPPERVDCDY